MTTKPDNMVAYDKEPKLQGQMFFQSRGHVSSPDKWKTLYFHFRGAYPRRIMIYDKGSPHNIDMTQESFDK